MLERIWTFIQTLGKGIVQGFNQFIENDLQNYIPLFITAAVIVAVSLLQRIIRKIKTK
jgi:hypothetical protein